MRVRVLIIIAVILAIVFSAKTAWPQTNQQSASPDITRLKQEANKGNAEAQLALGNMYHNGQGVPKNYKEAISWTKKAAEQGNADAQFNLGLIYGNGQGVPKNEAEEVRWYKKAAKQGLAEAQFILGVMYGNGRGVPKNDVKAYIWLSIAGAQGQSKAHKLIEILSSEMTPAQIAEAQKLAEQCFQSKYKNCD